MYEKFIARWIPVLAFLLQFNQAIDGIPIPGVLVDAVSTATLAYLLTCLGFWLYRFHREFVIEDRDQVRLFGPIRYVRRET